MVKSILLRFDEPFFYRMVNHKYQVEEERGKKVTWAEYVEILFGLRK